MSRKKQPVLATKQALLSLFFITSPVLGQAEMPSSLAERAPSQAESTTSALPSLSGLFQRALENDAGLTRQRYELQAVQEEVPMARSQRLPSITASGGYLWQDSTNIQTSPDDFGLDQPAQRPGEIDENYWQVQLQQPLFSLEKWRAMDVANAQIGVAELELALVEQELALSVSEAYVQAYLAAQRLGLLETQQESLELQVRQASRAFDLGVGNRVDLLEAQSRYDQSIADSVEAENELDNALSELQRLTGVLPEFQKNGLGDVSTLDLKEYEENQQEWLQKAGQNLSVVLAQQEQTAATAQTGTRRAGYYPEVNLNLSYSDRASDDELRASEDYRASVEVTVPIYRGGYTNASVRQGERRIAASQAALDNEYNLAVQEVRQRIRSLRGGARRLGALKQAISSGQLFLDAAERGEQLGLRDLVDVLDARATYYDQKIQYIDVVGQYVIDQLSLQAATGDLTTETLENATQLLQRTLQ